MIYLYSICPPSALIIKLHLFPKFRKVDFKTSIFLFLSVYSFSNHLKCSAVDCTPSPQDDPIGRNHTDSNQMNVGAMIISR